VAHHAAAGDPEHVLRSATRAAHYAWRFPTGLLADPRLERLVVGAVADGPVTVDPEARTGRVLHVLSEAYATGGHTRQVLAWTALDGRPSDVVLTNQLAAVPERLVDQLERVGGRLTDLRATHPGLLDRARALRALMTGADLVVLTVHPYDAVALAAVHLPGRRPPVLLSNHTDLTFWLGVAAADTVCDCRAGAATLSGPHRGVPEGRLAVVPLPVVEGTPADGSAVRQALGAGPEQVVALCVADDWKVAPSWGRGMEHALERVLAWNPDLVVVLVGITPSESWEALSRRFGGRVRVTGRVADPAPFFAAADLYLESYPVRAGTTPLEAAVHGLPVVALVDMPENHPLHVVQTSSPGLADVEVAPSAEKLGVVVRRLLADPNRSAALGRAVADRTWAEHSGEGWRASLAAAVALATSRPAIDVAELGEVRVDLLYAQGLLSSVAPDTSPDPRTVPDPLGDLADAQRPRDLFVVMSRDLGPTLQVRVGPGWADHEPWLACLLELCATRPRLAVTLPFLIDDDRSGRRPEARLLGVLAGLGRDGDDCGALSVDAHRPAHSGPAVAGDLPFETEALDWLQALVDSPLWSGPDPTEEMAVPEGPRVGSVLSR
jgi:hypothetical protein